MVHWRDSTSKRGITNREEIINSLWHVERENCSLTVRFYDWGWNICSVFLLTDAIWRSAATSYGPAVALKDTINHCDYQVTRINLKPFNTAAESMLLSPLHTCTVIRTFSFCLVELCDLWHGRRCQNSSKDPSVWRSSLFARPVWNTNVKGAFEDTGYSHLWWPTKIHLRKNEGKRHV